MGFRSIAARVLAGFLVALAAPSRQARACGPGFGPELFVDRAGTLAELPDGTFVAEAMRLLAKPAETFVALDCTERGCETANARSGGGARERGLYEAGATSFKQGDWEAARGHFLAVLALPGSERRRFSTFAAYMLGRMTGARLEARHWFSEVRQLARTGFDDPLGLAVASYGEEARVSLAAGDDRSAIRLYATQAAFASESGATSLLFLARDLVTSATRLQRVLRDPLAQRLLTTYVWTRGQETWGPRDRRQPPTNRLLDLLAEVPGLAGADRLAAAAWRMGRFDLAGRFADKESTPLALWVQAKLALRRGNRIGAERLLRQVVDRYADEAERRGKPAPRPEAMGYGEEPWYDDDELGMRAAGDLAVLALARADFVTAMDSAVTSCSYPDAAYLADRVLAATELAEFLEANASKIDGACGPDEGDESGSGTRRDKGWEGRLRVLLARRWLRSGRSALAMPLFDGDAFADVARQYVTAQARAQGSGDAIDKSEALFTAAQIARRHGMEILGTEVAPDWGMEDGLFDLDASTKERSYAPLFGPRPRRGRWHDVDEDEQEGKPVKSRGEPLPFSPGFRQTLFTVAERARIEQSAPPHPERFHYRGSAADLALQAAELLPRRSQAWASLLCHAATYVANTEPKRAQELWFKYTRFGAAMSEASFDFGKVCPQPRFDRARALAAKGAGGKSWAPPWRNWRRRNWVLVALGLALAADLLLALVVYRRRRRTG